MNRPARPPNAAVRLIFTYDGDDVTLVSRQRVQMIVPPHDELEKPEEHQGVWAEVRASDGSVLHRSVLHQPIRRDAEVFSDDPEQSMSRVPVERPQGAFTLVVPDLGEADYLVLMASPPAARAARPVAEELLRVPLRPSAEEPGTR